MFVIFFVFVFQLQHEVKVWDRFIRNRETVQHRFIDSPKSDEKVCDDAIIHQVILKVDIFIFFIVLRNTFQYIFDYHLSPPCL